MKTRTAPTKQLQCDLSTISPTATNSPSTPITTTSPSGEPLATPPPATGLAKPTGSLQAAGCEPSTISPTATITHPTPITCASPSGEPLATPPPAMLSAIPRDGTQAAGCEPSTISPTATIVVPTPVCATSPSGEPLATPPPAMLPAIPILDPRAAEYDTVNLSLIVLAENLHDIELTRIATSNRLRQLQALDVDSGEIEALALIADGMARLEHQVVLRLQRAMRAHPLGPWVKRSKGVGEKQAARLLASIGNPYWNSLHDRPRRGPAELWAYCGYHVLTGDSGGVAPKRRKGQKSNWNTAARTRAYLVAESCMKTPGGEYRAVYDLGRAKYAELPTAGHQHNRALRLVSKAVLRDIFLEAKAWHEAES